MTQHETSRTLVKSAPELWAECSDAASLARHLGAFGEIRITKLEPETAVAWEGTAACGTVRLEPSGWGTRVTMTLTEEQQGPDPVDPVPAAPIVEAAPVEEPPAAEAEPAVGEEPGVDEEAARLEASVAVADPPSAEDELLPVEPTDGVSDVTVAAPARRGLFARLMVRFRGGVPEVAPEPVVAEPAPEPTPDPAPEPTPPPAAVEPQPEREPDREPDPEPEPAPAEVTEPVTEAAPQGEAALAAALDSLGRAHHRPYSRA